MIQSPVSVRLSLDAAPLLSALSKLSTKFADGLFDFAQLPDELVAVQCDEPSAAGAHEVCVRLDPSEGLRGFLAALGARNVD